MLRDGLASPAPSTDPVVGDVLVLNEGDSSARTRGLIEAKALHIAEASLTGESKPVRKDPTKITAEAALADRFNMVYRGTAISQGVGRAIVTGTGMDTEVGAIADML